MPPNRQRRVHVKSRKGCGNCKLRKVKCDEVRPTCKKCKSYGLACGYGFSVAELEMAGQKSFQVKLLPETRSERVLDFGVTRHKDWQADDLNLALPSKKPPSDSLPEGTPLNRPSSFETDPRLSTLLYSPISATSIMATMINTSLNFDPSIADTRLNANMAFNFPTPGWHFSEQDFNILERFQVRTALTIGDKKTAPVYRELICKLAFENTFLMYMLLGFTLMHDANLIYSRSVTLSAQYKSASLHYWSIAAKMLNTIISKPIPPALRDAVWITGVFIGAASFWCLNSDNLEDIWPLKPYEPSDLAWLKLGEGKNTLWRATDPKRPDGVFRHLLNDKRPYCYSMPEEINPDEVTMQIPQYIKRIFGVTPTSTVENNIYHLALVVLSHLHKMKDAKIGAHTFVYVATFLTPEFQHLLEVKDPRAVFLIGWWFALIEDEEPWWMASRARIEGSAIRVWLQREEKVYGLAQVLDDLRSIST